MHPRALTCEHDHADAGKYDGRVDCVAAADERSEFKVVGVARADELAAGAESRNGADWAV